MINIFISKDAGRTWILHASKDDFKELTFNLINQRWTHIRIEKDVADSDSKGMHSYLGYKTKFYTNYPPVGEKK